MLPLLSDGAKHVNNDLSLSMLDAADESYVEVLPDVFLKGSQPVLGGSGIRGVCTKEDEGSRIASTWGRNASRSWYARLFRLRRPFGKSFFVLTTLSHHRRHQSDEFLLGA